MHSSSPARPTTWLPPSVKVASGSCVEGRKRRCPRFEFDHQGAQPGSALPLGSSPSGRRRRSARSAKAGANVKAVQRMLGHASAAMTLDRYADLFGDGLDDVADRMDALRAASRGRVADFL